MKLCLCIDYKMFIDVTIGKKYAMPLVDDLVTELEGYKWVSSQDAASGFWAIMMIERARHISGFVCSLGHYKWLRMTFGLKKVSMIDQHLIGNALWGYVQPKGGWSEFSCNKVLNVEKEASNRQSMISSESPLHVRPIHSVTKFKADCCTNTDSDAVQRMVNDYKSNMFLAGEPDESTLAPVLKRRSFVDDIPVLVDEVSRIAWQHSINC